MSFCPATTSVNVRPLASSTSNEPALPAATENVIVFRALPALVFGTDEHIRISYATSMEELSRGLDRIDAFVRRYSED